MGLMAECFFDYVDRRLIQLTDEFVLKVLRELGEKEMFGLVHLNLATPLDDRCRPTPCNQYDGVGLHHVINMMVLALCWQLVALPTYWIKIITTNDLHR